MKQHKLDCPELHIGHQVRQNPPVLMRYCLDCKVFLRVFPCWGKRTLDRTEIERYALNEVKKYFGSEIDGKELLHRLDYYKRQYVYHT